MEHLTTAEKVLEAVRSLWELGIMCMLTLALVKYLWGDK